MANVDKSVLGFVSGKLGDVVFRRMNGKKFVSLGAKKYKISQSAEAKKGRANFAVVVKFAVNINSIPELKGAWSSAEIPGTNSYHKILKLNAKLVNSGHLTAANKITPDGLPLTLSSLRLNEDNELELDISYPRERINFPSILYLIFVFNNETILKQSINIEKEILEAPIKIPLNNEIIKSLKNFPGALVFTAVLGNKLNGEGIFWTSTAAGVI